MGLEFDGETARKLEALYLSQDAISRRKAVLDALQLQSREHVLDIGTGLGFVAYDMATKIGAAGHPMGSGSACAESSCCPTGWFEKSFVPSMWRVYERPMRPGS